MEMQYNGVLIKTTDEGICNDQYPALVEIIDATTGITIYRIKAANKPGIGADNGIYPFISFELAMLNQDNQPAEECICPQNCDCQNPPPDDWDGRNGTYHVSNSCPIHNILPEPDPDCPVHSL